jgi:hypothetical protein
LQLAVPSSSLVLCHRKIDVEKKAMRQPRDNSTGKFLKCTGPKRVPVCVRIREDLAKRLRQEANDESLSVAELVELALREYLGLVKKLTESSEPDGPSSVGSKDRPSGLKFSFRLPLNSTATQSD